MKDFTVYLWANAPDSSIPSVPVKAKSDMEAAALSLHHFKKIGHNFTNPISRVTVDLPNGTHQSIPVRDVLRWLADPGQSDFVKNEKLGALLE